VKGTDGIVLLELGGVLLGLAVLARVGARVGLPAVPFYLLAGLAFGEGGVLPLDTSRAFVDLGAGIGLVLLLFTLGLEYSARELITGVRSSPLPGAVDLVNGVPGFAIALILGWGLIPAVILGGVTYITSSGIVAKLLRDLGKERSPEGRTVVSLLLIEDLVMVLAVPVAGALVAGAADPLALGWAALAVVVVGFVLATAVWIEAPLARLLRGRTDEALLLSVLGFALLSAGIAEGLRISSAIGALLAGILLSGSLAASAKAVLSPLRDLFAALFFFFEGLAVRPGTLVSLLGVAVVLGVVAAGAKLVTGRWTARRAGMDPGASLRTGILMVPRGEFSVALAAIGAVVEPDLVPLTVALVVLLAVLSPVLYRLVGDRGSERRSQMPPG
jgi:CPA2 family monovalent cation:H+ antiporter-2